MNVYLKAKDPYLNLALRSVTEYISLTTDALKNFFDQKLM